MFFPKLNLWRRLVGLLSASTASSLAVNGIITAAPENNITAFAGGGQGSATALSASVMFHRIATVATALDSVKLPLATVGQVHFIRNDGANVAQIYGSSTDTINAVATATGVGLAPAIGAWFVCFVAGAWVTSLGPATTTSSSTQGFIGGFRSYHTNGTARLFVDLNGDMGCSSENTRDWGPVGSRPANIRAATAIFSPTFVLQSGGTSAGGATTHQGITKAVSSIADNTATAVFTVTVPNAAHSASIRLKLVGSLGSGGAVGANESTQDATYNIDITRTAGVNAVATISAVGAQPSAASVAGAANAAVTGELSSISGGVGATNTFTINAKIAHSGGSSANHACVAHAELVNANTSGVTIA